MRATNGPGILECAIEIVGAAHLTKGFDRRKALRHACSAPTASRDEIEKALEDQSRITRFESQWQPVPPKGGQWID